MIRKLGFKLSIAAFLMLFYPAFTFAQKLNASLQKGKTADADAINAMPEGIVPNAMFEGHRDLHFKDRSTQGLNAEGFNGSYETDALLWSVNLGYRF